MKNIKVERYTSDKKSEWNVFLATSKNGTFLLDRNFMEYHSDRFIDFSLMVYQNEKLVALFPANVVDDVVHSHQGLSYGGLILNAKAKYQTSLHIFNALLAYYHQYGIQYLEIKETPNIYTSHPNDELLHFLFLCKAELTRRDGLSVIDFRNVFSFSRDRKAGIKRGLKHQLKVKEVDTFDEFWNEILIPNLESKHGVKPVHTLEEISLLKNNFPKQIKQFNVYKEDKIVAGTTIFVTQKVAHSQYISGNSEKNELGSLDFLHNHILKEVFTHKDFFDFGISNEEKGTKVNKGLQYWKESFGARTVTQDFYRVATKNYSLLNNVLL